MITANYHTHTTRCNHAQGTEREYIEQAIKNGIKVLGFSDHSPQFYNTDFVSGIRMLPSEFGEYVDTLLKLRAEYADKIEILIGLEAEYFPKTFNNLLEFITDYPIDYLILGQHYSNNEDDGEYLGYPTDDPEKLRLYTEQVISGIKTGCFSYVAHPDLVPYRGDEEYYKDCMTRICVAAKKANIPLEINILGILLNKCYPSKAFFKIAKEIGNKVIIGIDAHTPDMFCCEENYNRAMKIVTDLELELTDKIDLKFHG